MKTITKSLLGLLILAFTSGLHAQVTLGGTSYTENFDGLANGLPEGWSVRIGANSTSLGTIQNFVTTPNSWGTSTAGFRNVAAPEAPLASDAVSLAQEQSADRALGLRQTAAFADVAADLPAFTLQLLNTQGIFNFVLNFKLMQCHALLAPQRTVSWIVEYAIGDVPTAWLTATTTPSSLSTTQGNWGSTDVQVTFPSILSDQSENVWIRIRAAAPSTGTNSRPHTAIDDVVLTYFNSNICVAPGIQASDISFNNVTNNSLDVSWTDGSGEGRVVIMNTSNSFTAPADYSNPLASTTYSGGQQVVYNGTSSGPITITGLNPSTQYWFRVYEFCEPDRIYQTSVANGNEASVQTDICVTDPGTDVITACAPIIWIDGNTYSQNNNSATYMLTTNQGCDSLVTLNLTINEFEAETTLQNTTLTAFPSGAAYQWVNCDNNNAPISGATGSTFTPTVTGNYAVIVTVGTCSNQSLCTQVTVTSGLEQTTNQFAISIFPNPTSGKTTLSGLQHEGLVNVVNLQGQVVYNQEVVTEALDIETSNLNAGVYFVQVNTKYAGSQVLKLVVESK